MDVTNKPLQLEEFEVWGNCVAFSLPHPSHECLDTNVVEVPLSFQTPESLCNMN
jgi:hypothetical protein